MWLKKLLDRIPFRLVWPKPSPPRRPKVDDPVCEKTSWERLERGGSRVRTRKLVVVGPDRVEVRTRVSVLCLHAAGLLGGLLSGAGGVLMISTGSVSLGVFAFLVLFSSAFTLVGGGYLLAGLSAYVFDKRKGMFWKGLLPSSGETDPRSKSRHARLDDIWAIQLITEHVERDRSSYYSHEMNLVLTDGRRITVADHGDLDAILDESCTLADFLDVPVWDAT